MRFYKITNEDECHNGLQYHDGLNVDLVPWYPHGSCQPGGIYFSREDILAFIDHGPWIREVTLPPDARVYKDPREPHKWKADKVILGPRRKIDVDVVRELIAEGADIHVCEDWSLRIAAARGHTKIVRMLLDADADVHACEDEALREAEAYGHTKIVAMLQEAVNAQR